ncbi:MAG TPA: Arm DNA-binding domain-containing protein, partial [Rhizomicrobium sp.]|nr:Arm DNA-binding domain-containing protein [Rhizomicrobium sp.]
MRLTDISVKALKPKDGGIAIYYDDTLTGFGVRVSEGGTKSFVLTHGRRRVRETIGRVGIVSLQDARA